MENTRDTIQNEAYFKYSIQMALQNKFSWTTLASMLDQMTPTVGQSKELVRVLLKELQNLQKKHQELIADKIHRNENDEVENLGELENANVQGFDENIQKDVGQINNHELPSLENEIEDVEKKIEIDKESLLMTPMILLAVIGKMTKLFLCLILSLQQKMNPKTKVQKEKRIQILKKVQ